LINQYFIDQGDAKGAKGKTAAVIAEDNDSGKSGVQVIAATAEHSGMKVVYEEASMPAAEGGTPVSDFSPFVTDILTSNDGGQPDVVFAVISRPNLLGFAPALENAGFEGLSTNAVLYSPLAASIMKDNFILTQFSTPEAAPDVPAVQEFVDAVEATAPGEVINQPTIAGYLSADMLIQAIKKAGKNPTRESVQKAAAKMTYELEGFVGPTKYPTGFKLGTPCGQLVGSDGTAWSIAVPLDCFGRFNVKTGKAVK
jgi:ABC-type branched-subunit amino acid transport system substrate-binding protein